MTTLYKHCPGCKSDKPLDAFNVDRSRADGRSSRCSPCAAKQKRDSILRGPSRPKVEKKPAPVFVRPDLSWHDRAACRGQSVDLFFGRDNERGADKERREKRAREICADCPVKRECGEYALSKPEKYGIYGGMTEDKRQSERRRRQRQAPKEKAA